MTNDPTLDKFGEFLARQVRDKTINDWKRMFANEMKGVTAEKVRQQVSTFSTEQKAIVLQLVPQIVDTVLHNLLFSIEQEKNLDLTMKNSEGVSQGLKNISDGLAGELYGPQGWIARFSAKSNL
jgi:hypothetical protein